MTNGRCTVPALLMWILICCHANALTIKLGSLAPNGSPWDKGLRRIAAEWSRISNGKVVLKIYSSGVAGGEEDMIRKMRIGQLGAAGLTGVGMCRIFSGILAVQLPLLVRTDDELYFVLDKMRPAFEKELEDKGFKVLIWSKVGWVHFFSKRPVVRTDDLKAQKMFIYAGDPDDVQAWKNAGFHPVPLSPTDLMTSLQSGMVETFTTTPLSAAAYQWFGLAKNMCGMKWAPLIGGIVISQKIWQKVPADLRQPFLDAAKRIGDELQEEIDRADARAVEIMKQHGLTVHEVSPEAEAEWKAAVQDAFFSVIGKSFDVKSYELTKKYLAAYRATMQTK